MRTFPFVMGIDGIGKKGPAAPGANPADATPVAGKKAFEVDGVGRSDAPRPVDAAREATPLARLERGEIDVDGYVELRVEEATRHLKGLRPEDLELVKSELRHRMQTDPALVDLVTSIAGKAPTAASSDE